MVDSFRRPVESVDKEPKDYLHLTLMFDIKLRLRFGVYSDTNPYHQPFRESEHVFVRLIVTNEKQTDLPEVTHQRQDRQPFPALPRREHIYR